MQLAQAYLASEQPARVLQCTSLMQGLSTGRAPPAGLLQLSSLALLQQGKLGAASAQLCAWLQQGAQGTEEACTAVRSFLIALHSQASTRAAHSGDGPPSAGAEGDPPATGAGSAAAAGAQASARCSAEERAAAVQQVAAAAADRCRSDPAVALEVVLHLLDEQVSESLFVAVKHLTAFMYPRLSSVQFPACSCQSAAVHEGFLDHCWCRTSHTVQILPPATSLVFTE